jgi:hypothetical protein
MLLRTKADLENCVAINVSNPDGSYLFVHSATYEQLLSRFGLAPGRMAEAALQRLRKKK